MRLRSWSRVALALGGILLAACQGVAPDGPGVGVEKTARTAARTTVVRGQGFFPERQIAATAADVTSYATATLLDATTGRAIATGLTDAQGSFTLAPGGTFSPALSSYYYLQVAKRVGGAITGTNQVSLLTVLKWTSTGWASITNAVGGAGSIVLNPTTTAVALIDRDDPATAYADVIGKVSGAAFDVPAIFTTYTLLDITTRVTTIKTQLQQDVDPVGDRAAASGLMAPDDAGDVAAHHDYKLTKNGQESTFVWIPVFAAYQLIDPTTAGHAGKRVGSWVKVQPASGTPNVHWARETFGGFYVAKYEAARNDAVPGAPGTGVGATAGTSTTTLKVQAACVPWADVDWDTAAKLCLAYDVHAHLLRDDEWTALAVWSMINNVTVYGNNNSGKDQDDAAVTFVGDPNEAGRSLTGTGTRAGWTGTANFTTHTGTTAGVYDLNGNVWEWTETVGSAITTGNYIVGDVDTGLKSAKGNVNTLSTDPRLRRYGLPGTTGAPDAAWGGDYFWLATTTAMKMERGGSFYQGANAGVWCSDLDEARTMTKAHLGFRPALSFR